MANMLGGALLPRLTSQSDTVQIIGPGLRRAVDGTGIASAVRVIHSWRLECRYITWRQYLDLLHVHRTSMGGGVAMHLDEWGEHVYKIVSITSFDGERKPFQSEEEWERSGRILTLEVEEL